VLPVRQISSFLLSYLFSHPGIYSVLVFNAHVSCIQVSILAFFEGRSAWLTAAGVAGVVEVEVEVAFSSKGLPAVAEVATEEVTVVIGAVTVVIEEVTVAIEAEVGDGVAVVSVAAEVYRSSLGQSVLWSIATAIDRNQAKWSSPCTKARYPEA